MYVDSGSTDNSIALARSRNVAVVELDLTQPFTAARARNEGFRRLQELAPSMSYVFFVDGDCEVACDWVQSARQFLDQHPGAAVVCGWRRERHPDQSVYNLLCDIEWDGPVGEVRYCGGDAVMRATAFKQAGGYRADMICGEEPELCVRLRQANWQIWRIPQVMTLHDAAIHRFGQWWRRMKRGGYAFALGAALHGAPPERHWVAESRRIWIWGLGVPAATLILVSLAGAWGALLLLLYPLQIVRLALLGKRTRLQNWLLSLSLVVGKFPEMLGQLKFVADRMRRSRSALIEYK